MVYRSRQTESSESQKQTNAGSATALTDTQAEILEFIRSACTKTGMSPSYREIQEHFGYKAIGTVQDHVKALIKKGFLEAGGKGAERKARGLIPKGYRAEAMETIPIYGEIAAGSTREADQIELGTLTVPAASRQNKKPSFALRVVGDSMQDIGILEGDMLIVHKQERAKNGDIVVALLNGETTVKRYEEKGGEIFLVPENKKMKPIAVGNQELRIQGKVVGLQRDF